MHRLPGIPDHSKAQGLNGSGGLQSRHPSLKNSSPAHTNQGAHHARAPKMLVRWQRILSALFKAGSNG